MNFWAFSLLLSVFIWSLIYAKSLILIYCVIIGIYSCFYFYLSKISFSSFRRRMQIASWNDSGDPSLFGRIEVDMAPIDAFLDDYNSKNKSETISSTVLFAKAISQAL